ncbi:MAG: hypothetical protein O2931_01075 [Planctomycetota bacterium]|nr:hypothetical protein [Planctomycetota bacterium]
MAVSAGKPLDAKTAFLRDLELSEEIAKSAAGNADAQAELSYTYNWLQRVNMDLGDTKAALDYGDRCVAIQESLTAADPHDANRRAELAKSYSLMGDLRMSTREFEAAREIYAKCHAIASALVALDSTNFNFKDSLAYAERRTGNAWHEQNALDEARVHFDNAIIAYEQLVAMNVDTNATQRNLATTLRWRGRLGFEASLFEAALPFFERDVQIMQTVYEETPDMDAQDNLNYAYSWLGSTRIKLKQTDEGIQSINQWIDIARQRFDSRPNEESVKSDYLNAIGSMANVLREKQQYNEAIARRNEFIRISSTDASAYDMRGHIYFDMHDWKNAIADYSKAIDATFWRNRSNTHLQAQELKEAQRDIDEALRRSPDNAESKEISQKIAAARAKP